MTPLAAWTPLAGGTGSAGGSGSASGSGSAGGSGPRLSGYSLFVPVAMVTIVFWLFIYYSLYCTDIYLF